MTRIIFAVTFVLASGCASAPEGSLATETADLGARLKAAQDEAALAKLRLADEMERADVQNYLRQQEVAAAKRETAAMKARCGAPCATP